MHIKKLSAFARHHRLVLFLTSCLIGGSCAETRAQTTNTNSVVRFRIAFGTTLVGDIDVELFDADKPITVSNFLAYAQSGRYSRTILHDLIPGFVLQGGGFTVPSPFAASSFQVVNVIPKFPSITNEFNSGTVRSNVYGTIAMFKDQADANSATSRWFFNLGDNSRGTGVTNLNTLNGGYTVFGKVTGGFEILQFFNGRSVDNGIRDMNSATYRTFCSAVFMNPDGGLGYPFGALPVSFTGIGCPNYSDLFNVELIIISARDVLPPKLTIDSPAENAKLTNSNVTVRGTVSDNVGVATVKVYHGTNTVTDVLVTNGTWTTVLTNVPPGTNSVLAEALDTSGLRGQATRTFFRSVRAPVSLSLVGFGTVSGVTDQQLLEIGRGYTVTAKPAAGNLFAGWEGDLSGDKLTQGFLMQSNFAITAVFVTNLFPNVKGTYSGLFFNPNQVELESSGYLTLTLADSGAYSAKVLMNGRTYPLKGVFSPDGHETNWVARTGTNSLLLTLALDLAGETDVLTGTVTNNQATAIDTNRGWSATLLADRAVFHPTLNPAPQAGRYTLLIPPDNDSPAGPTGDGFASVSVTTKGAISMTGTLAEGSKLAQKSVLSKNGAWPLYVSLNKGSGVLVGWVTFTNEIATDFMGLSTWIQKPQPGVKYYPTGFTNETTILGSRFSSTTGVLDLSNAVASFAGGNLAMDFANDILIGPDGKVVNQETNKLTLAISKSTGLFNGTVTPPGTTKSIPFKGALLQKQDRGAGFFLGTNQAGSVTIGP
jgi:cyclophilin family peptidyl-prolyl cis-trans isomerase